MKLSVIVPVLNEAAGVPALCQHLMHSARQGAEVILVDGGSEDRTAELVERLGFRLVRSARGRALQMNAGAAAASGDVLLFLHADTRLPPGALACLQSRITQAQDWGRFDVRIEGRLAMLKLVAWLMNWRSRLTGIATGDQAMFMTRAAFDAVGGFPLQPLMEDIEMSSRLRRLARPLCLSDKVVTSGRRWEQRGLWRTIFLMWRLRWAYWRGVPASQLAKAYR
ncbi:MAG: TIGR04283 family arsenosugar biosynthesis glycosyltransferase [Simplicispira suum]|uniref:TIGR04283 family arsenosugar biosynthesis glycosyltransferase n=1 Tax=Simplicispira suum TaxID=2109915 RepID=UPI001C6AADBB|nr:TIGR04283 family arsenosugar biosynthesis glycosyltransferase [Simplicispira suum]MBW7833001.1 TIGR04283 family arsenosugar biosynthesis glycosyltransferase [Simplicispira suum]